MATGIRSPHPVDIHVGARIRLRRQQCGMSQGRLGDRLGLTFQQVQKYEKGSNRVSASKLWSLAGILGVTISWFFEEYASPLPDGPPQRDAGRMYSAFNGIKNNGTRRCVVALCRAVSESPGSAGIA